MCLGTNSSDEGQIAAAFIEQKTQISPRFTVFICKTFTLIKCLHLNTTGTLKATALKTTHLTLCRFHSYTKTPLIQLGHGYETTEGPVVSGSTTMAADLLGFGSVPSWITLVAAHRIDASLDYNLESFGGQVIAFWILVVFLDLCYVVFVGTLSCWRSAFAVFGLLQ